MIMIQFLHMSWYHRQKMFKWDFVWGWSWYFYPKIVFGVNTLGLSPKSQNAKRMIKSPQPPYPARWGINHSNIKIKAAFIINIDTEKRIVGFSAIFAPKSTLTHAPAIFAPTSHDSFRQTAACCNSSFIKISIENKCHSFIYSCFKNQKHFSCKSLPWADTLSIMKNSAVASSFTWLICTSQSDKKSLIRHHHHQVPFFRRIIVLIRRSLGTVKKNMVIIMTWYLGRDNFRASKTFSESTIIA